MRLAASSYATHTPIYACEHSCPTSCPTSCARFFTAGTYNNAYGVLSLTDWAPGKALQPGTLTYVEQIPGLVVYGDVTERLELGYVPMYNVPYWPQASRSTAATPAPPLAPCSRTH